jgi:DNA-binding transcriptional MocR family regulator
MTDDTERRTQTTQLYERLRTSILTLELLPGQSLAERGLEARFEASRTPVRAALVRLEAEGLVRRDGRSFAVAPIDLAEIGQLAEYREAVETAAVRLAVQRASDDDLDALAAELTSMAEANAAGDSVQAGGDFHSRLAQLAGGKTRTTQASPGMRLVREWNGVLHVVTVAEDGAVLWNEKSWRSLSEVARAITGTRWSGPAFFGLKHKRKAAA